MVADRKRVLHVGCGAPSAGKLPDVFAPERWDEVRLDIDPGVAPDLVASTTDMAVVADGSMDAVYSAHNVEHLYPHEVPVALREFRRVLNADGFALILVPDLQEVGRMLGEGRLTDAAYISPLGPIRPLDILFGFAPALAAGNLYMAHHTGFTGRTLMDGLLGAGFAFATVQRNPPAFCLYAIGFASVPDPKRLAWAQRAMFPLAVPDPVPELA